ncbi:MAG: redoxin domain-containing protein, partial [Proteobacteria bacterium]|nr:redoxin domain-containing protein [Pseudomonadota bacterium]
MPKELVKVVNKPTLLVYFTPLCPHCRHVAAELEELHQRISPQAQVLMVAAGTSLDGDIAEYKSAYKMTTRFIKDQRGEIGMAIGARSTPSALLLMPEKKRLFVEAVFYPLLQGSTTLVEMRLHADPWQAFRPGEFHGVGVCGACHQQEAEAWVLSRHSVAWQTLVKRVEQYNDKCNGCHVTGKGQPGGWTMKDESSPLVSVGCEACHGPGGPHDGETTDSTTVCVGCHDKEHSMAFSLDKAMPFIDHYSAVALDEQQFQEARRQLVTGEAPRAMLAFPEGEVVGAAKCLECHSNEHSSWLETPHAQAMARLSKGEANNGECVACHATAVKLGPR